MSIPAYSVRNPVFANLLMVLIVALGAFCMFIMNRAMFPEFSPGTVIVTAVYPGASPSEIEQGVTVKIEDKLREIDGVKTVRSVSREGASIVFRATHHHSAITNGPTLPHRSNGPPSPQ